MKKRLISMILAITMMVIFLPSNLVTAVQEEKSVPVSNAEMSNEDITRLSPVEHDWKAKWIWAEDNTSKHNWIAARKTFEISDLNAIDEQVLAMVAVDSRYWLWINGQEVIKEGGVKRGPTLDDTYMEYIDISEYLVQGENTVSILGFYFGNVFTGSRTYYSYHSSGQGGLLFEADLGDGTIVATDETWKVEKHPAYGQSDGKNGNYRMAEGDIFYEAHKAGDFIQNGKEVWMNPDYDDSKWNPAVVYGQVGDGPWNDLYERSIPQLYYSEERAFENSEVYAEYVDNYTTEEIKLEMKLPGNIQMNPVLELEAETDGLRINMETDGNQALCAYYFTTQGYQKWECYGWMSAQTLTITIPAGVKIKGLYYKHSGYDTQLEGSFTSDDPFMNQLWEECYNTLYICMRDNFMDCPDRERAQWWGDVTCQMNESFYSLDSNARLLYRKGVDQILGWIETEDTSSRVYNALRTVVPSNDEILELPHQELYGITGFWTYYLYTGEIDFLEQVFEPSVNYLKLWDMQENGLPAYRNGTWNWIDWGSNPDSTLIQHAWYYYAADCVLKMADELGIDNEDISLLEQRMESIKVAFDREYWKGSYYYNSTRNGLPDDRANAIAVLSGLASEDKYPDIIQILSKNETAENNYTKNSSPYFENFVQNAMFMMGYDDEALDRIKDRYGEFIDDEWTTLAEFFYDSGGMSGAASQNHAWSSSPMTYLSGYAAGIKPVTAGYETWQVLPQMGSLKTIETRVPAEIGNIDVSIHKTESSLTMSVTSPGKTAEIWVPLEEGQDAGQVSGAAASYLGEKTLFGQNYAVYSISEAGNYTFAAHETGVNKDILRKVLSYAEAQYSSPAFETVITDVQVTFTAALEAARLVNIDLQADQKTVDAAWQALMTEIHKLGFVQGDKTILNQLIEIADTFSAQIDNYTPVTAQPFTQALLSAKTVLEDGNAMQGDVSKAESALLNAMMNLRYKADRSVLTSVLAEASRIETAAYTVQSVTAFSAAYDEAITVNNNLDATQTEVNDAAQKLRNAINGLVGITAKTTGVEREGDANLTGGRGNAKTGENSPIAIALSLCMLAGAGFILSKKRK